MTDTDQELPMREPSGATEPSTTPEPPDAPEAWADVPFANISILLRAGKPTISRLTRWAQAWALDPQLSQCPITVLYYGRDVAEIHMATADLPNVTLLAMKGDDDDDQQQAWQTYAKAFDQFSTPWFSIYTLRRRARRTFAALKRQLAREHARVTELDLLGDRSILLHNPQRRKGAAQTFVWHTLTRLGSDISPTLRDYLGLLSLASGTHKLEGVDLRADTGELELFARISTGRLNTTFKPPWDYRLAVVSPQGTVLTEQPAVLQQRLDSHGGRRWENLIGRLSLDDIPEGNHRFVVGIDAKHSSLRSVRTLQPRPGVLAPARTVLVRSSDTADSSTETRYLIHTVRGSRSWITIQRGIAPQAGQRWSRTVVKKDLRQIAVGNGGPRMRAARLERLLTLPSYRNQDIWLIGERADTAQDNGFHLFRHLRQKHPDRPVYYIIDKASPQYDRVRALGNVVDHSSRKHQRLMMHASVLANAYSIKHMIPRQWSSRAYTRSLAWRVGALRVYLKHGVHVSPTAVKRGTGGYDVYLGVNQQESAALRASSGYRDHVVETGMPRYDTLLPAPSSRTILFMPTWRRYLVPKLFGPEGEAQVPFEGSTYQQFIQGLLASPQLHDLLERHDYRLRLLPHYNLRQELESFALTSDRTEFADTTTYSFQDLIREADVFLTDYSSVHFDVAYLGTPIIYTHFDREDYEEGHAVVSWFNHETDGFGPVVHSLDETLLALDTVLSRGCTQDPAYASRVADAFTFHDHNNSARVVEEIDRRLARSRTGR